MQEKFENTQKKVFFNLRKSSRERMWDTAREASRVCTPIMPSIKQQTSVARFSLYRSKFFLCKNFIRTLLRKLPIINYQSIIGSESADLIYMWGAFPVSTKKPFIIEIDNPFVLTYYNQYFFKLRLFAIKKKLREAKYITFISNTARDHFLYLCGNEFTKKCKTLPPFMEENYTNKKRVDDGKIRFLFVGLGFRRKGGPELLEAFSRFSCPNALLTIVATVDDDIKEKYISDSRIVFEPIQSRQQLFDKFYPTHDVLVFPSLHESFGVVVLEAMSFGLGIIATNVYATPELVETGVNGVLLKHPFLNPTIINGRSVIDCVTESRKTFSQQYFTSTIYESLVEEIVTALQQSVSEYQKWQHGSVTKYESSFSKESWEKKIKLILQD